MKKIISLISIITVIVCACVFSEHIISGCAAGLFLWYSSVLPVILPFMLITALISDYIKKLDMSGWSTYAVILTVGLLCGFPTGTMIITSFCRDGHISGGRAQLLLPLCNNVSSMFLWGYIYRSFLSELLSLGHTLLLLYVPQLLYTAALLILQRPAGKSGASEKCALPVAGDSDMLSGVIRSAAGVGVYMSIFSVFIRLIISLVPNDEAYIASAFFEISQGVSMLSSMPISTQQKTALILSLTSFGGLSAIYQSHAFIREAGLSFFRYICGKCICAALCYACTVIFISMGG